MRIQDGKTDPFRKVDPNTGYLLTPDPAAFGDALPSMFVDDGRNFVPFTAGENEYWRMWIFLTEFGIKPHELELIPVEDLNVLYALYEHRLAARTQASK